MNEASFDSTVLIDSLNGHAAADAELRRYGHRWISRIAWIEVMSGLTEVSGWRVETFLGAFDIDEVTLPIARRAAELRNTRKRLRLPDAVIFASAQVHGRVLVTRNTRDFPAGSDGVRIPYSL